MAKIYQIKCPDCGAVFQETKGCTVRECGKPLLKERESSTPFNCPTCGRAFCAEDEDFHQYVQQLIMID